MQNLANKEFNYSGGIFKSFVDKDGGLSISGYATLEVADKTDEIIDFPSTVAELEKWSNDTAARSRGLSKGNLRVMHSLSLGGKVMNMKAVKTTVGDKEVNAVLIDGYIPPSLKDVIDNVQNGLLNGFSIGGRYKTRPVYDPVAKANRYTPIVTEISLVDSPCVPGADILEAIAKCAIIENGGGDGSVEEALSEFDCKISDAYKEKYLVENAYVCRTFPDKVIICVYADSNTKYYDVAYSLDADGCVILGEMAEVEQVTQYIPVEAQTEIEQTIEKAVKELQNINEANNTMEVNKMTFDEIKKAVEDGTISTEQIESLLTKKADEVVDESTVEDTAESKEEQAEALEAQAVELQEEAATLEDEATAEENAAESTGEETVEKAGKSISSENANQLALIGDMASQILAIVTGLVDGKAPVSPADNSAIESAVKAMGAELQKSIGDNLNKADLQKSVDGLSDTLKSAMDEIAELKKTVQEIHDAPVTGGPISAMANIVKNSANGISNADLMKAVNGITDPTQREMVSMAIGEDILKNLIK